MIDSLFCSSQTGGQPRNTRRAPKRLWFQRLSSELLLLAVPALASNAVTLTETTGSAQMARPVTISRVFAEGEIANYPRPSVGGTSLPMWQTNVLSHWAGGSVKQALITFPQTLSARGSVSVNFVNDPNPCYLGNQATCDASGPSQSSILGFNAGSWDADIETTQAGTTHATDARAMISNGSWRFWITGPLVSEIIVEDRSAAHAYDYGYKDQRYTRTCNGCSIASTDTTATVLDAQDIASLGLPTVVQVDGEKMVVSAVNSTTNVIIFSTRGYNASGAVSAAATTSSALTGNPAAQLTASDNRVAAFDTVVISGGTGCWAALNGTWSSSQVNRLDGNNFTVEANVSACSGSLTGTVRYATTSSSASPHSWYTNMMSLDQINPSYVAARNSNYVSLHPIFVVTQYTGWPGVKVEYILENPWIDRQQDQQYNVALKSGLGLNTTQYTKANYLMGSSSRWRKTYWDGTTPGLINVDFNFPYMISTKVIPNYDTSLTVPGSAITAEYANWTGSDQCDLGGHGEWQPNFQAVGGRPDLGPFPLWTTMWLASMNNNIYTDMMGNAECIPQVGLSVHMREDMTTGYWYDAANTIPAFGHEISIYARPGLSTLQPGLGTYPSATAFPYPVANATGGIWSPDVAHQASFAFIPYIATGDWYWYEELLFWSTYDSLHDSGGATDGYGFLTQPGSEPRGLGWGLRNIAHAAFASPDSQPSQLYHKTILDNNIAYREGMFDITNGSFYNSSTNSPWSFGFNVISGGQPNALRILRQIGHYDTPVDTTAFSASQTCGTGAPWQDHLNIAINGHIEELGYSEIDALRKAEAALIVHEAADPAYNPYLSGAYHAPAAQQDGKCGISTPWIQTWAGMSSAWIGAGVTATTSQFISEAGDANFGYPNIARAAASYATDVIDGGVNGQAAWTWLYANANNITALSANPQWAILPRNSGTSPFARCDLNSDGILSILDVVVAINQVIGNQACSNADLNGDGHCDVLDVVLEINAVNTQSCRIAGS